MASRANINKVREGSQGFFKTVHFHDFAKARNHSLAIFLRDGEPYSVS